MLEEEDLDLNIFATFSFDVIILLVLAVSFLTGIYLGLYRQAGNTLVLALPLILLYFLFDAIMTVYIKITGLGFFKSSPHRHLFNVLIAYALAYVILAVFIWFIYRLFRPSVQKRVLNQPSRLFRILGGTLGLLSGYVICLILIYVIKPFININYHSPLTRVLIGTESKVITISKLNRYQNINVEKFHKYQKEINLLTGRTAFDFYSEAHDFLIYLPDLEIYLETEIHPLLSDASKALIEDNLEGNNYLQGLVKRVDNKRISELILENEKANNNFSLISSKYALLRKNEGYILVYYEYLNTDLTDLNFYTLINIFEENQEEILKEISDKERKEVFNKGLEASLYYKENSDFFINEFSSEGEISDIAIYVKYFESLLKSLKLQEIADEFLKTDNSDYPILKEIFRNYLKYKDRLIDLPPHLSFEAGIILSEEEKNWLQTPLWENHVLIKSYLLDCLSSSVNYGHELYSEYFFTKYLADPQGYDSFGIEEFQDVLLKLDEQVTSGLLNQNVAEKYINSLLLESDSIVYDFVRQELADPLIFQEIVLLENKYLTDSLKAEILKG
jgi:hypothetical protein